MTSRPSKREREPLTIKSAHLNMIEAYPNGLKGMAMALGDDTEVRLKNQAYEQKGMHVPTERSLLMQEFTGRCDFAEAVAYLSGGVFVKLPDFDVVNGDINEKFMDCIKTLGQMAATFQDIIADDIVTTREYQRFEAIKQQLCTEAAAIVLLTGMLHNIKVCGDE